MKIDEAEIQKSVRAMQIIVAALATGVIFFGVLTVTVLRDATGVLAPGPDELMLMGLPLLTALAVIVAAISLIASFAVPRLMVANGLRVIAGGPPRDGTNPSDTVRLLGLFQGRLIVASATNEGGAFFALLAYMIEGRLIALAVAAVLLAVLLSRFPTADRVRDWLDLHLERLVALRREGSSAGS